MLNRVLVQVATSIIGIAIHAVVDGMRVLAIQFVAVTVGLAIGVVGLGFLFAAAYMALERGHGGPQAAAAVAILLLVLCAACGLGAVVIGRRASRDEPASQPVEAVQPRQRPANDMASVMLKSLNTSTLPPAKGDLAYLAAVAGLGIASGINEPVRRRLLLGLSDITTATVRKA